jgi:hypothetical protein
MDPHYIRSMREGTVTHHIRVHICLFLASCQLASIRFFKTLSQAGIPNAAR